MNVFYSPGGYQAQMLLGNTTIGPILGQKTGGISPTYGTVNPIAGQLSPILGVYPPGYGSFPRFGKVGKFADAGEVADCLNQLVLRIQALEAFMGANPSYGVVPT